MNRRRLIFWGTFVFLCLCYFTANTDQSSSSYNTSPYGTKAIFSLFEQRGQSPLRLLTPFSELDKNAKGDTLIIVSPPQLGMIKDLLDWVKNGNRLLLFVNPEMSSALAKHDINFQTKDDTQFDIIKELTKSPDGTAIRCPSSRDECSDVEILSKPKYRLSSKDNSFVPLNCENENIYYAYQPLGAGDIFLFGGPEPICNMNIDKHDNLRFIYQLVSGRGRIIFDEFHHGFRNPVSAKQLNAYQNMWCCVGCLTLGLILVMLSRAVRFGPPRLIDYSRQGSADFIMALSTLYRKNNAQGLLINYLTAWISRVARLIGLGPKVSQKTLIDALSIQSYLNTSNFKAISAAIKSLSQPQYDNQNKLTEDILLLEDLYQDITKVAEQRGTL